MLSQADINTMEMAHTHAQAVKKKTALETVFIGLFKKYMDGRTLSKLEERAIKDYLRVYRSEFATLKKKAKANASFDKVTQEKTEHSENYYKMQGLVVSKAFGDFSKSANKLRTRDSINLFGVLRLFLLGLGFIKPKDINLVSAGLRIGFTENHALYLIERNSNPKWLVLVTFPKTRIGSLYVLIPTIYYYSGESKLPTVAYLSNFNTPKQVVLNLIGYAKHKDDAIMAKDNYEMVSDEFMYFEEKKIIEVMSKNIDRNIIKFVEI